jgi:hypothetical protein
MSRDQNLMDSEQGAMPMTRFALSQSEGRFFGLDALEWSATLVGFVLVGVVAWLV